jgi:RND superfamily putative drug exporter
VSRFLDRLGRRAARHHWWFIAAWIVAAVVIAVLAKGLGGQTTDNFRIPGTQSQEALDLLEARFPQQAGSAATVVIRAERGITNPAVEPAISASIDRLEQIPHVTTVTDPYGPLGAATISKSGDIALVNVQYDTQAQNLSRDAFKQLEAATAPAARAGVKLAFGGAVVDYADQPPQGNSDLIGLLAAVVILLFAFGSVVAMGLPNLTALFGLGVGISVITVVSAFTDIGTLAPVLATMIGLGVGIDYSLFIVTRYRENLAAGMTPEDAIGRSVGTAGMAVLFAGSTVVIAICGLAISGISYVARLGYTAAAVVAVMMVAAVTLLPALIGVVGRSIDRFKVPSLVGHHGSGHQTPGTPSEPLVPTFWARWATNVAQHAWPFAIGSVVVLLTLAYPLISMRLGQSDDGNLPRSTTQRQAYDLVAEGFGPGTNGPLLVVVSLPPGAPTSVVNDVVATAQHTPDVAAVLPAQFSADKTVAAITVFPKTAPDSAQTAALVSALRTKLPSVIGTSSDDAYVGGVTASYIDIGDRITDRLPYFIGAVVLLSFILLLLVFHSVLVRSPPPP